MSAADTNVLVRFYVEDDKEQFRKALEFFESATSQNPVFVNHVVLTEWVWVLLNYYKVEKQYILEELQIMLNAKEVEVEDSERVKEALEMYKNTTADFADCLIAVKNSGFLQDPTYTFDKKAAKLKGMKFLN